MKIQKFRRCPPFRFQLMPTFSCASRTMGQQAMAIFKFRGKCTGFTDLPAEVREMVYEHIWDARRRSWYPVINLFLDSDLSRPVVSDWGYPWAVRWQKISPSESLASLLRTCKVVHQEVIWWIYKGIGFSIQTGDRFSNDVHFPFHTWSTCRLEYIQILTITVPVNRRFLRSAGNILEVLGKFEDLRELYVSFLKKPGQPSGGKSIKCLSHAWSKVQIKDKVKVVLWMSELPEEDWWRLDGDDE
ncbi:hypothetical protein ANO11243_051470 [Dothideomycetidae sp. 11243]|nr:hypothetical protein ANO11243_051470 [fungal sp. No.11243]